MIDFRRVEKRRSDEMFSAMPQESKWGEVVGVLLAGQPVFVPYMSRNQLETLRTIIANRRLGLRLKSRTLTLDDQEGKLLRVEPQRKARKEAQA
jgi:hypothetical protein